MKLLGLLSASFLGVSGDETGDRALSQSSVKSVFWGVDSAFTTDPKKGRNL
jgi:hypothetical protein